MKNYLSYDNGYDYMGYAVIDRTMNKEPATGMKTLKKLINEHEVIREGSDQRLDLLTSVDLKFQEDLPLTLFVYPANVNAKLPDDFVKYSLRPESPLQPDPELISRSLLIWLDEFTNIMLR